MALPPVYENKGTMQLEFWGLISHRAFRELRSVMMMQWKPSLLA
jgi:hypothetical protein